VDEQLQELREELRALVASFEYAYAMGHSNTIGDHPRFRAVREHAADLRARIEELTE
jgi:hypothetical protein